MFSLKNLSNPEAAISKLLSYSGMSVDIDTINDELEKHPDYPSLLSISDVLTVLKIENNAFYVDFEQLEDVSCPFIAHTYLNGGSLVVVNKMKDGIITISSEKWEEHKLNGEEFKNEFAGIVIVADPTAGFNTAITNAETILTKFKSSAVPIGVLLILVLAVIFHTGYISNFSWQLLLLTLFKSTGLLTSIVLLMQSNDSNNPLVQVFCQTTGKTDCNAILSSKAAKVPIGVVELSWSEVGFFYFAGTWLLLLFGGSESTNWLALALLNFISLPYTVYSIYYQARIAKQWCVFCCAVQILLWLEFVPLSTVFLKSFRFPSNNVLEALSTLIIWLLIPVVIWALIKPLFLRLQQLNPLKQQLRQFKYNTELFNKLLTSQPKYAQPDEDWSIVLGNTEASNTITMVTNPYCPPCAKTHQLLEELLRQHDDLQARIVFTANNTENDIKTPVSRHFMALSKLSDRTIVKRALYDWYEQKQKNYEAWAKIYPVQFDESEYYKIESQKAWCKMAKVTVTPTLLLNGSRLPDLYQLPDIKYMLG